MRKQGVLIEHLKAGFATFQIVALPLDEFIQQNWAIPIQEAPRGEHIFCSHFRTAGTVCGIIDFSCFQSCSWCPAPPPPLPSRPQLLFLPPPFSSSFLSIFKTFVGFVMQYFGSIHCSLHIRAVELLKLQHKIFQNKFCNMTDIYTCIIRRFPQHVFYRTIITDIIRPFILPSSSSPVSPYSSLPIPPSIKPATRPSILTPPPLSSWSIPPSIHSSSLPSSMSQSLSQSLHRLLSLFNSLYPIILPIIQQCRRIGRRLDNRFISEFGPPLFLRKCFNSYVSSL